MAPLLLLPLLLGLLSAVAPLQIDRSRLQWLARGKVEAGLNGCKARKGNGPTQPLGHQELRRMTFEPPARGEGLYRRRPAFVLSHNMDLKYLAGADPELILLNIQFEELQRIPLSEMTRDEINQLIQELGFYRKETPDSPVPDAFQMAPANSLPPDVEAMRRHRKEKKGAGGPDL